MSLKLLMLPSPVVEVSPMSGVWVIAVVTIGIGGLAAAVAVAWCMRRRLRRLQLAMQSSERMRLLGQVSGGLAHQLRNGVAGAKLAVQLHARSCDSDDGHSLDVTLRQLARVEADLARFLDLGRDAMPHRPCHLVALADGAVSLLRPQCRHADVQLCWEPPPVDPLVNGDPGRLGHIVVNLLSNAVEAARPAGVVELTVEQTDNGFCRIEVWDSGLGPDPEVAGRLFQPFVSGKPDGVGLGLFVARQAAEAHGGRLDWLREGVWTCFWVELPVADAQSRDNAAVMVESAVRG